MKPSEILAEVRDLLARPDGWIQGEEMSPDPTPWGYHAMCLVGAFNHLSCAVTTANSRKAQTFLYQTIAELYPKFDWDLDCDFGVVVNKVELRFNRFPEFNDDSEITQEDVLTALDKARIKAEEVGK